ncbi:MAG: VanZ family protein [Vicinamibacterales bacterium]
MSVKQIGAIGLTLLPILLFTTWPLRPFAGHAHWDAVEWLPFSTRVAPFDFIANVALFMPFGLAIGWPGMPGRVRLALMAGAATSIAVETYQVYCHLAFAATADVLANTLGAWLGASAVRILRARAAASPQALPDRSVT